MPAYLTDARRLTKHEGLQPRANVRPRVGCSEKLGAGLQQGSSLRTYEYPHRSQSRKGDEVAFYH